MTNLLKINILENLSYIITFIFLLVVISYYVLIFVKQKKPKKHKNFLSLTVIIPAHNEERYIKDAIESVIAADFKGFKQIIVVDDGSTDRTAEIAYQYKPRVTLIKTKHSGKSASINRALHIAKSDLVAIVDGDSCIDKNALEEMRNEIAKKDVSAVCGVVKVKNRNKFICMWIHIEQLYNSLIRLLFSKINANITTPGPLSMYVRKDILEVGSFSTEGFSEDVDITIKLIRKGYRVSFAEKAVAETNMPYDIKGFFRQRTRFARGLVNILKRHMKLNKTTIDIYTLPLLLFTYLQAVIMGSFIVHQIISGYFTYFALKGIYFNTAVFKFFFEWFSIVGFIRWISSVFTGQTPLSMVTIAGIVSTLLTYPLYFFAIYKFDKKLDAFHLIPIFFMFPFWLLVMIIYIACLPEYFKNKQYNIWKKNE